MTRSTARGSAVRYAGIASAAAVAASLLVAGPAATATDLAPSRVTAHPSDDHPASGEQFVIRGRLTSEGAPIAGAVVHLRSYNLTNGTWSNLKGARVTTNSEGRYRVRVILSMKGGRRLMAVANPPGDDIKTARRIVSVIVQ
jgi:hypothetical protein